MIDEKLPLKLNLKLSGKYERRGKAFAADDIEEFWALLLEKAFAKLVGGYMKLEGGTPACALTYLSLGFSSSFDFIFKPKIDENLEFKRWYINNRRHNHKSR